MTKILINVPDANCHYWHMDKLPLTSAYQCPLTNSRVNALACWHIVLSFSDFLFTRDGKLLFENNLFSWQRRRKSTWDESRRSAVAAVCSTWRHIFSSCLSVELQHLLCSEYFIYTEIVIHWTMQYEDGEETKSDFLARMILEGRIDYDAEKK